MFVFWVVRHKFFSSKIFIPYIDFLDKCPTSDFNALIIFSSQNTLKIFFFIFQISIDFKSSINVFPCWKSHSRLRIGLEWRQRTIFPSLSPKSGRRTKVCARCYELDLRSHNHRFLSSIPGSWSQVWDYLLAQTFDTSTGSNNHSPTILKKVLCPFSPRSANLNVTQLQIG